MQCHRIAHIVEWTCAGVEPRREGDVARATAPLAASSSPIAMRYGIAVAVASAVASKSIVLRGVVSILHEFAKGGHLGDDEALRSMFAVMRVVV